MDPYLENPTHWSDVHHGLISEIQARLNQQLRPKYFARVEERVYISDEYDVGRSVIIPDVRLMTDDSESWRHVTSPTRTSGTATIEPIEITTLIDDEIHEARLEIIDVAASFGGDRNRDSQPHKQGAGLARAGKLCR